MQRFNFAPYEGSDKYIFVSYSHANSHLISDIVERLNSSGYHIWYDSGIEYGEKWIRSIEEHLRRSSIVLSFISPEYSESDWCMREYTYAERIGKKVIHVKIADGVLEGGLAMMISTQQIINDSCYLTSRQIFNEVEKVLEKSNVKPLDFTIGYHDDFEEKPVSSEEKTTLGDEVYPVDNYSAQDTKIYGYDKQPEVAPYMPVPEEYNSQPQVNKQKKSGTTAIIACASVAVLAVIAVVMAVLMLKDNNDTTDIPEETQVYSETTVIDKTTAETTEETTKETTEPETTEEFTQPETTQPETTQAVTEQATVPPTTAIVGTQPNEPDYFSPDDSDEPEVDG